MNNLEVAEKPEEQLYTTARANGSDWDCYDAIVSPHRTGRRRDPAR